MTVARLPFGERNEVPLGLDAQATLTIVPLLFISRTL